MSALGGSIEALLKLNISDFENNSKKAVSMAQDLQKGMNLNNTGIQKATSEVSNLNSGITATEKSTNNLGSKLGSGLGINGIQKTSSSVQTLSSRVQEAGSFASALGSKFNGGLGVSGIQKTSQFYSEFRFTSSRSWIICHSAWKQYE